MAGEVQVPSCVSEADFNLWRQSTHRRANSFCVDCTPKYQIKMTKLGRCDKSARLDQDIETIIARLRMKEQKK